MKKKIRNVKKIKKINNISVPISYEDFKEMVEGLTDDELDIISDWLSSLPQKPSEQ